MGKMYIILQGREFKKIVKKLHSNQKKDLDEAIKILQLNPELGIKKRGDLSSVWVYKFRMINQLTLLAYQYYEDMLILKLLYLGSHENFYRDLKKLDNK